MAARIAHFVEQDYDDFMWMHSFDFAAAVLLLSILHYVLYRNEHILFA